MTKYKIELFIETSEDASEILAAAHQLCNEGWLYDLGELDEDAASVTFISDDE
jgi:hypothetical protein